MIISYVLLQFLCANAASYQYDGHIRNYPLLMAAWKVAPALAAWKVAPALAAGCAAILKPSELASVTCLELAEVCKEVGLPPGVLNILTGLGPEAGAPLVCHPHVDKIAFTGSTATGSKIMTAAAQIVKESIATEFLDSLVKWCKNIKISDPMEEGCRLGPVISAGQHEKVMKFISTAKSEGATILCGGARPQHLKKGYFVEPMIITDVTTSMQIWREEVFGPVLCVKTFSTEDEAMELANDTRYGLGAAMISRDLDRCERVTKAFQAGIVWVNCSHPSFSEAPWGGNKRSGFGREFGEWGLQNYSSVKQVTQYMSDDPWGWYQKSFEDTSRS